MRELDLWAVLMLPMGASKRADDPARTLGFHHDGNMYEEKVPQRESFWAMVRQHPVPWVLFLATTLAAIILSFR